MKGRRSSDVAGQSIAAAISLLQKAFEEAALILRDFDEILNREGWRSVYGNKTYRDTSRSLNDPRNWVPQGSFRLYAKQTRASSSGLQVRLGLTIQWWNPDSPAAEPLLFLARIDAKPNDFSPWDVWIAWAEAGAHAADGTPVRKKLSDWSFVVSARPLTSVKDKKMLQSLASELLAYAGK